MADTLWQYSLTLYRAPGVERATIALQDSLGADVNLLLCCCFAAHERRVIEVQRLHEELATWRGEVSGQLRCVRRRLKREFPPFEQQADQVAALRKKVADVELESERVTVAFLAQQLENAPCLQDIAVEQLAARHLALYLRYLSADLVSENVEHAAVILTAATELKDSAEARAMIRRARAE